MLLGYWSRYSVYLLEMEVERSSFHGLLPAILKVLSRAHFISFDLELSGIHDHRLGPRSTKKSELGAQTLQERYIEVKEAAEKYQILQVGLTCVEEDSESGKSYAVKRNGCTQLSDDVVQGCTWLDHTTLVSVPWSKID